MLRLSLLSTAAILVAAPAFAQDDVARVDAVFKSIASDQPGCAIGVSAPGRSPILRAYGLADLDRRTPITVDTAFDIASVHKQFVAAAVLLLAEDGRLRLSDDVRTYIPELPSYGSTITLDHLLTHTSGLRDWTLLMPLAEADADAFSLIVRQRGLNFAPGEEWSYSNSGYVLLKEIVARVSGLSFADFVDRRIFEPLQMNSSAYVADPLQGEGERALAYRREGEGWRQDMRLGRERGGGGVVSSVRDLLIWNDALANGRLSRFVTQELQRPAVLNNGRVLTYARGLNVEDLPGEHLISHSGGGAGYSAWLGRFEVSGVSTAVLCNFEPVSATNLAIQVSDLFLPPPPPRRPTGPVPFPGVDLAGRDGVFIDDRTGEVLRLAVSGDRLAIAGKAPLIPIADGRFAPPRRQLFYRSGDAFELRFATRDAFDLVSMEGQVARFRRARTWAPSSDDLAAMAGRYFSPDLGAAFDIMASADGLWLRAEGRPEMQLPFKPIERDLFLHEASGSVLRIRRDQDQAVIGIEHHHPGLRHLPLDRVQASVLREPTAAAAPQAPVTTADPDAVRQEALVGEYVMPTGLRVSITLENGVLFGQPAGRERRALTHLSGTTFEVDGATPATTVTFTLGEDGRATAIVMEQEGRTMSSASRL